MATKPPTRPNKKEAKKGSSTHTSQRSRSSIKECWSKTTAFFSDQRTTFTLGLILAIFSIYMLLAFTSFFFTGAADQSIMELPSWHAQEEVRARISNWTGLPGAILANVFIAQSFGVSAYFLLAFMFICALRMMRITKTPLWGAFFQCSFWLIWLSVTIAYICPALYDTSFFYWGGAHGDIVVRWMNSYIKPIGTGLILFAIVLIFCVCSYSGTLPLLKKIGKIVLSWFARKPKQVVEDQVAVGTEILPTEWVETQNNGDEEQNANELTFQFTPTEEEMQPLHTTEVVTENKTETEEDTSSSTNNEEEVKEDEEDVKVQIEGAQQVESGDPNYSIETLGKYDPTLDLSHYKFPMLDLLKTYPNENTPIIDQNEQHANINKIVTTLRNYGIEVNEIKATVGPTITLYEIVPKAGVRIAKIRNLESDIMLSLAATGIRIIAPIPGKGTIGIEVPNEKPQIVSMHSVIASKKFQEESKFALPVALGRTITNDIFMFDLAKTPHLLVAGATGQGKSVGLNAIITSLLYKKHPAELKFVLVDPKMVEFNIYAALEKHYMAKMPDTENVIITDSTKVIQTLNSLVIEMEERYKLLMTANCRNLAEYNDKFINRKLNPEKGHRYLPYIVIVIDEFGDLIMVAGKEIEMPISRITQKARAVGMHMILATQRPSVNIITGVIKANVPSRIAFRVSSMIDSRTILDAPGANQLVGKGDLLYSGGSDLIRVQCAFVDTPEVENIVNHVKEQQSYPCAYELPDYVPEGGGESTNTMTDMSKRDALFEKVARWVVEHQQGSTSAIQRSFEIGYNRAGRITDQLEAAGIVSANNGSKGRQVLVQDDYTLTQILESLK